MVAWVCLGTVDIMTNIQDEYDHDTHAVRATRFVYQSRIVWGEEFCDRHSDAIADIIFHAVTNWVYPTHSGEKNHNQLAWEYIVSNVRDLRNEQG